MCLNLPEVKHGDNLAELIVDCAEETSGGIRDFDIIVVTSKVISES